MDIAQKIQRELASISDMNSAAILQRFFKTGLGEYGEGDIFRGIRVPVLRAISKKYDAISLSDIDVLLRSKFHEDRLLALLMMVRKFVASENEVKKDIYDLYLSRTVFVNNWDLVDTSAEHIVGAYLIDKDRETLYRLVRSQLLWERRIAIMSTFHYIKRKEFVDTLKLAELLLGDKDDLIHKAVGWMLREIGKRNLELEEEFLNTHSQCMPRVMLRYAIEKFPEVKRQLYLNPHKS